MYDLLFEKAPQTLLELGRIQGTWEQSNQCQTTMEDYDNLCKLIQTSPDLDMNGWMMVNVLENFNPCFFLSKERMIDGFVT
ncbi:hypothetical protein [Desulfobacula toluolica]|uniref:Uncharacterized protein n=1 Tax=Desulfobacula toluolica (strain DSM 7467 / Tol2) TaxID=651182 RepID=K0NCF9_DESTT|nr:hypothetical protein [Desulfobacula toluolica]CCK78345.1 uncharacterized protein TOL2_C01750 [Desulfobacula toluolica Tol2]